jgi:hypothetical protein
METTTRRPMTAGERAQLERHLEGALSSPIGTGLAVALVLRLARPLLVRVGLPLAVALSILELMHPAPDLTRLASHALLAGIVAMLAIGLIASFFSRAWVRFTGRLHEQARADLAANEAEVREHAALGAVAVAPDREGPPDHIVEVAGERLMYVHAALVDPRGPPFPADRFELAFAPRSGMCLGVTVRGAPLAVTATLEPLTAGLAQALGEPGATIPGTLATLDEALARLTPGPDRPSPPG